MSTKGELLIDWRSQLNTLHMHGVAMPPPPGSETHFETLQYYMYMYSSLCSEVASSELINLMHVSVTELWTIQLITKSAVN